MDYSPQLQPPPLVSSPASVCCISPRGDINCAVQTCLPSHLFPAPSPLVVIRRAYSQQAPILWHRLFARFRRAPHAPLHRLVACCVFLAGARVCEVTATLPQAPLARRPCSVFDACLHAMPASYNYVDAGRFLRRVG